MYYTQYQKYRSDTEWTLSLTRKSKLNKLETLFRSLVILLKNTPTLTINKFLTSTLNYLKSASDYQSPRSLHPIRPEQRENKLNIFEDFIQLWFTLKGLHFLQLGDDSLFSRMHWIHHPKLYG